MVLVRTNLHKKQDCIKMGDSTVVDMMSYMRALSAFEPGQKTKVVVDRKGTPVEVDIEF